MCSRILPRLLAISIAFLAWTVGAAPAFARPPCQEMRSRILTTGLASTPYIVLTAGGRTGPWLVDFGSTITSLYSEAWKDAGPAAPERTFAFGFPGVGTAPLQLPMSDGGRFRLGVGSPLGRLGTDILKDTTTEFHFENASDPYVVFRDPSCERDPDENGTEKRFGQTNFFGAHPETQASGRPNVPVVFLELEERSTDRARPFLSAPKHSPRTFAQLDTGYADTYWPYSVDINEAYLAQLKQAVPSLTLAGLVSIGGCGQEDSLREVYLAPGWRLTLVPDNSQKPIPFDSFALIVKPSRTQCGGIGLMREPAAQLGASFLRAFGTTRIEPGREALWVRLPEGD